ncbi:hypothetical protein SAMN05444274_11071 [Mariniphaga anaerophila]|uniref:Uncharacterized protein n=1 Tax=Mariniphaga anaerophila TaxID=1484053 RepID=A0A1M5EYA1_9BACT|nr:hypothetical protein SAMN05444274_11071 [Mariniphaga anaerophila]
MYRKSFHQTVKAFFVSEHDMPGYPKNIATFSHYKFF